MTVSDARRFVGAHHRHALPPVSGLFAVGADVDDEVVGVGVAGRPVAWALDDGRTIEVTRVATDGAENACSMIYGALTRAAKALGYDRAVTYTLAEESGASLKASGWRVDAQLSARASWSTQSRPRVQMDLFGTDRRPPGPKVRWIKEFGT